MLRPTDEVGDPVPSTTVGVVIASAGRPALVSEAVRTCSAQHGVVVDGVISVPDEASLPQDRSFPPGWRVVTGVRGLAAQRNAGLDALRPDVDVVAFFDDDSVLRQDYLANAVGFLDAHPDILGMTGQVVLDGAVSGEITAGRAEEALRRSDRTATTGRWRSSRELYGCNFAFRRSGAPDVRFDERLPLYSWLEDHDFARRLLRIGPLARVEDCVIVHRAAASGGRQAHMRLGYSQVMNPVHLLRTGSFPAWLAAQQIARPVAKNLALSSFGAARPWRRERLRGNVLAAADLVRGRITPERVTDLAAGSMS